jgi:hypothetical protein
VWSRRFYSTSPKWTRSCITAATACAGNCQRLDRVIAATPQFRNLLSGPMTIEAPNVIGVTNQQGASRVRAMVY